jgi:predicted RNA-binding Zn-ribbon protein involved in translation (DUF1610 family)
MTNNQLIAKVLFGLEPTDFYLAKDLVTCLPFKPGIQGNGLSDIPFDADWNYLMWAYDECADLGFNVKISNETIVEDEHFNEVFSSQSLRKIDEVYQAVVMVCKILTATEAKYEDGDVHVCCPSCGNTESHPQDEQRHHLQHFSFWQHLGPYHSWVVCNNCGADFIINWKIK